MICSSSPRITLACIGLTWLVIGTSAVGVLPNWRWPRAKVGLTPNYFSWRRLSFLTSTSVLFYRLKSWISEWVHVICYRICARGLSATIRYHSRRVFPWTACGFLIQNIFSYVLFYFIFLFFEKQGKQTQKRGNLRGQSHLSHWHRDSLQRRGLRHGWNLFLIFTLSATVWFPAWWKLSHSVIIITNMLLPGGSGSRGTDGSPAEGHGEGLPSHLVRESRDERSPPSD